MNFAQFQKRSWIGAAGVCLIVVGYLQIWADDERREEILMDRNAFASASQRPAENYIVARTPDGIIFELDPKSVTGNRNNRRAALVIHSGRTFPSGARNLRENRWFNCERGTSRTLLRINYDPKWRVTGSTMFQKDEMIERSYSDGTVGAAILRAVCEGFYDTARKSGEPPFNM
ncbi:hypothetical protein K3179_11120 [Qipengyuania sp. GH38]|uniref:surface-adhesin E family protein n=1 Tax=Qipengyuania intermedia TaxID=2867244 RepID=UPI001C87AB3A|nr:surface-adhesin E family protein [Qipengyuania intermedia]MBX7515094.1 hypothetical protein [Qipengyuania intermedia]